jgi:hypothetical protein
MLSGYQCEVVAYLGDGGITCADCFRRALAIEFGESRADLAIEAIERVGAYPPGFEEFTALIRYELESGDCAGGEYCESCGDELSEPCGDSDCEVCGESLD